MDKVIEGISQALKNHITPVSATDTSVGGVYYLRDLNRHISAVFKPMDEEPFGPNNHTKRRGRSIGDCGFKHGIKVGGAAAREVAAYILDTNNVSSVPMTTLASINNSNEKLSSFQRQKNDAKRPNIKTGSLQVYCRHICSCEDVASKLFPVYDVQKIALLDIRIFNMDRHLGNILFQRQENSVKQVLQRDRRLSYSFDKEAHVQINGEKTNYQDTSNAKELTEKCDTVSIGESQNFQKRPKRAKSFSFDMNDNQTCQGSKATLVPIDHGFCLPRVSDMDEALFEWSNWEQAKLPILPELKKHIAALDYKKDTERLQLLLGNRLPYESIVTMQICTIYLQEYAMANKSLHEMAKDMCGSGNTRSIFQNMVQKSYSMINGSLQHDGEAEKFVARIREEVRKHLYFKSTLV